jgi:hypothetical protein
MFFFQNNYYCIQFWFLECIQTVAETKALLDNFFSSKKTKEKRIKKK